jgi:hypothetical protein
VGDWNMFFSVSAASSATLVGLLFVATQLHLEVFTDPTNRWAALAQSTLTILSVDFSLSLFMLMPVVPPVVRAEVIAGVVAFGLWRTFRWRLVVNVDADAALRVSKDSPNPARQDVIARPGKTKE